MTHERVDQKVRTWDGLINLLQSSLQIEFMNVQQALGRLRQTKLLVGNNMQQHNLLCLRPFFIKIKTRRRKKDPKLGPINHRKMG